MKSLLYVASALAVLALAFWAYRENYATQASLREVRALQSDIAELREAMSVQRAEWAYLNRPDRLRELTTINFDRLGLLPLEPGQFGAAQDVTYPLPPIQPVTELMDVSGLSTVAPAFDPDVEPFP
jgi:hypothetical protein